MALNPESLQLYLVTDPTLCPGPALVETVSAAVRGGFLHQLGEGFELIDLVHGQAFDVLGKGGFNGGRVIALIVFDHGWCRGAQRRSTKSARS
ncbi:MAG: hypothetical protein AAF754_14725 [Pseudomonadota bacterium]